MTNTTSPAPRIYVACLAAYNNGYLHGAWIDADQEPEAITEEVRAILAASPIPEAEEWAIHDHEGFEGAEVSEWSGFAEVSSLAGFIAEHGALGGAVLRDLASDLEEAQRLLGPAGPSVFIWTS